MKLFQVERKGVEGGIWLRCCLGCSSGLECRGASSTSPRCSSFLLVHIWKQQMVAHVTECLPPGERPSLSSRLLTLT